MLQSTDHHCAWVNTAALRLAGIDEHTPDPPAATIARRADGTPMGTLVEWTAMDLVLRHAPPTTTAEKVDGLAASHGDAGRGRHHVGAGGRAAPRRRRRLSRRPASSGRLSVRVDIALRAEPGRVAGPARRRSPPARGGRVAGSPMVSARTVKFFADGVVEAGTAAMLAPYTDRPHSCGLPVWGRDELAAAAAAFDADGFRLHIHAIGDAGVRNALDAVEHVARVNGPSDRRPVIAHTQLVDPADVPRFAQLGVIANVEPLWAQLDPLQVDLTMPRLGAARSRLAVPVRVPRRDRCRALDGQRLAGQLPPPARRAGRRGDPADPRTASPPQGWLPHERLAPETALSAYTAGSAYQSFEEGQRGVLGVGARADLVWLARDPLATPALDWPSLAVRGTWLGGISARPVPLRDRCRRLSRAGPLISWRLRCIATESLVRDALLCQDRHVPRTTTIGSGGREEWTRVHQFVAGRRRTALAGDAQPPFDVVDPATGETVETVALAGAADVDAAVAAARSAFPDWSRATPAERSAVLTRLAAILDDRADELARPRPGRPASRSGSPRGFDVPGTVDNIAFFAGAARNLEGKAAGEYSADHTSMIRREAIGVVGSIAPWNYPLQMAAWKILPAIAAGNTIVLKPAEITPLTALHVRRGLPPRPGIPDGVVNVVTGTGPVAGEALDRATPTSTWCRSPARTGVGRRVMELAAGDRQAGAPRARRQGAVRRLRRRRPRGRRARRGRRLADQHRPGLHGRHPGLRAAPALRRLRRRRRRPDGRRAARRPVRPGAPTRARSVSRRQQERVAGFVERARGDGAKVVCGGAVPGGDLARGAYYEPTLVVDAAQDSEIVQDEVFGPVLVVLPFDSDDEGIALANDTPYGLAASAWTRDVFRSLRATREIRAGCVWVNDHIPIISEMPHGGYKASGFGKDMSHVLVRGVHQRQARHVRQHRRSPARTGTARSSPTR